MPPAGRKQQGRSGKLYESCGRMFEDRARPIIFAHRGSSSHAPENTLAAFRFALDQGADGIELDAKLTADGRVVVMHDATLDRTTSGRGYVWKHTLAELRKLDAGSAFSAAFEGEPIPTLDEVLELAGNRLIVNIELSNYSTPRDSLVQTVCAVVRSHATRHQVLFSSFLPGNLARCARLMPEAPRGLLALPGWKGVWARSVSFMFGAYDALHAHTSDTTREQVQRVHRLRRRIHVWTVNRAEDFARFQAWGVDGIFTDDPPLAAQSLGRLS